MHPKPLKILHFMPDNFVWGGIETYLKLMLPILKQHCPEYDITAVVTQDSQLFHALKNAGIKVIGLSFPLREKSVFRSMWVNPWLRMIDLSVYIRLLPILFREKPDLVHIHNGRIEQALIKLAGFPLVYTYHGYGGPYDIEAATSEGLRILYKWTRFLFQWLVPFLDGMTVVSQAEINRLHREKFLPDSVSATLLHNGIPTADMLKNVENADRNQLREQVVTRLETNILKRARLIAFTCRLRFDRNPLAFLRIAKKVVQDPRRKNPVYFLVAGEGKLAPEFEQAFSEDPILKDHGQYLGFRNDVPQLIKACDLTVNVSLHEGFGLRVLESLLFGKPCITYAAGGIPEVMDFDEARQWLIPLNDEEAFVTQLIEAINLPDEALLNLAPKLEAHAKKFDIQGHVDKLEIFYHKTFTSLRKNSLQQAVLATST